MLGLVGEDGRGQLVAGMCVFSPSASCNPWPSLHNHSHSFHVKESTCAAYVRQAGEQLGSELRSSDLFFRFCQNSKQAVQALLALCHSHSAQAILNLSQCARATRASTNVAEEVFHRDLKPSNLLLTTKLPDAVIKDLIAKHVQQCHPVP